MRIYGDNKCNRWYFKFNGNECSGPMTTELLFTATGRLGTLICSIIGHLRGTVKISHKERLEWHYG